MARIISKFAGNFAMFALEIIRDRLVYSIDEAINVGTFGDDSEYPTQEELTEARHIVRDVDDVISALEKVTGVSRMAAFVDRRNAEAWAKLVARYLR